VLVLVLILVLVARLRSSHGRGSTGASARKTGWTGSPLCVAVLIKLEAALPLCRSVALPLCRSAGKHLASSNPKSMLPVRKVASLLHSV